MLIIFSDSSNNSSPPTPPDLSTSSVPLTPTPSPASPQFPPMIDVDQQTDSNSDTALTLAAAGGHDELVTLLLVKGSDIEHRDKKGIYRMGKKCIRASVFSIGYQEHVWNATLAHIVCIFNAVFPSIMCL